MPVPATSGTLRTTLTSMNIGDYIVCNYQAASGAVGSFSNLGGTAGTEISLTGDPVPNGTFYFIKADRGLLIADRVIQNSISWDTLNTGKFIQGSPAPFVSSVPLMTSNTTPSGIASTSLNQAPYPPYLAFDRNTTDTHMWDAYPGAMPQWIAYEFTSATLLTHYSITNYSTGGNYPKDWVIEGSNDSGTTWVSLDSQTGTVFATGSLRKVFKLNTNNVAYKKYRMTITVSSGANEVIVSEWELIYGGLIRSLTGGVSFADVGGNSTTVDAGKGAWTPNNEWDKYIVNSTLFGSIIAGNDNAWHWSAAVKPWTQDTPILAIGASTLRVTRGQTAVASFSSIVSSTATTSYGFRPVLEH